jgi:hypothetical protein
VATAKEHRQPTEAARARNIGPSERTRQQDREVSFWHLVFNIAMLIFHFWLLELRENKFMLFKTTKFVAFCYRRYMKLIQVHMIPTCGKFFSSFSIVEG